MDVFDELGRGEVDDEMKRLLEKFVCSMYGQKKLESVDDARLDIFLSKYKLKSDQEVITAVKKMDGSTLPPCAKVLYQKILRVNYIARMWRSATEVSIPDMDITEMGWCIDEHQYKIKWFEDEVGPKAIDIVCEGNTIEADEHQEEEEDENLEDVLCV